MFLFKKEELCYYKYIEKNASVHLVDKAKKERKLSASCNTLIYMFIPAILMVP